MKSTMASKSTSKLTSNKPSKPSPTSSAVPNASDGASDSARASDNDHQRHAYALGFFLDVLDAHRIDIFGLVDF